jgi:hypothetical protein
MLRLLTLDTVLETFTASAAVDRFLNILITAVLLDG